MASHYFGLCFRHLRELLDDDVSNLPVVIPSGRLQQRVVSNILQQSVFELKGRLRSWNRKDDLGRGQSLKRCVDGSPVLRSHSRK